MSFKIVAAPTFEAKVKIAVPGQEKPGLIKFVFKHKTKSEFEALFSDKNKDMADEDLVMEIASNWDIADTPFTRESLANLFENYLNAPTAIIQTFVSELKGARLGN
jgi:hypothetical protein